jgi:hypothetical protein
MELFCIAWSVKDAKELLLACVRIPIGREKERRKRGREDKRKGGRKEGNSTQVVQKTSNVGFYIGCGSRRYKGTQKPATLGGPWSQ